MWLLSLSLFVSLLVVQVDGQASSTNEPCAQVSALIAPARVSNPKVVPMIPGAMALSCLMSVPLHKEEAMSVTGAILPYVEFQSDLSFKKAPPADFPYPAIDVVQRINNVVRSLENNTYPNEYSWQVDLFNTFMAAKDGHLRFAGDLLVRPVRFTRNLSIVSVSMDGKALPQMYLLDDIQSMGSDTTGSFTPSAITKINGVDATTFAQREGDMGLLQDPDASFNFVMYSNAIDFTPGTTARGGFGGDGRSGFIYPGDNTTFTFANGSTTVVQTLARIPGNFTGVTSGESAFQKFCNIPAVAAPAQAAPAAPTPVFAPVNTSSILNSNVVLKGFPKAQVIASDGTASGYYLKSQANSGVGVLFLRSFMPTTPAEYQAVIQTMLAEMKRDGKTKLIIDLQGNGGGIVNNGFDAFRQLFPTIQDKMFARQRIGPTYQVLQEVTNQRFMNFSKFNAPTATDADLGLIDQSQSHWNVKFDLDQTRAQFTTVTSKFGPKIVNGDTMTNLQQWDWSDQFLTSNSFIGTGMNVTGYGDRTNFTQPFAATDIVMLYDGACASTCTIFSEMMRNLGSVKSIMLGGRPTTNKAQAIGGIKGAQSLSFAGLRSVATGFTNPASLGLPGNSSAPGINNTPFTASQINTLNALSDLPTRRSLDNGVNFSDMILEKNVEDGLPAQYVQEPADCRVFFTPSMIVGGNGMTAMENQWEEAANVAFKGKACVVGGISAGVVARGGVREERQIGEVEMKQMIDDAAAARQLLRDVRMKSVMEPVVHSEDWWEKNRREVPSMLMM